MNKKHLPLAYANTCEEDDYDRVFSRLTKEYKPTTTTHTDRQKKKVSFWEIVVAEEQAITAYTLIIASFRVGCLTEQHATSFLTFKRINVPFRVNHESCKMNSVHLYIGDR